MTPADERMGFWLSAALDDPKVCAEMKADINAWFASLSSAPQVTDKAVRAAIQLHTDLWGACTTEEKFRRVLEQFAASAPAGGMAVLETRSGDSVMVPREPTPEMIAAADDNERSHAGWRPFETVYRAMISAAPSAVEDAVKAEPTELEGWLMDAIDNESDGHQRKGLKRTLNRLRELETAIRARKP